MRIEEVIGTRISEVRKLQEMTQEQLGQRLGELLERPWSRQAVHTAEQGGRQFTAVELIAIAHVLNTTVPRLMTPDLAVRDVEMPSGATLDRLPLAERVHERGSLMKMIDEMAENLRTAIEARQLEARAFDAFGLALANVKQAAELEADSGRR